MPPMNNRYSNDSYIRRMRSSYNNSKRDQKFSKDNSMREFRLKRSQPSNVLRLVVMNACYVVTTETLHFYFTQYGNVLRIVIFEQNGIQNAMIEFDSIQGASRARDFLNGFNMYDGCNELNIEFSWTPSLTVTNNNINKSWDYTQNQQRTHMTEYDSGFTTQPMYAYDGAYYNDSIKEQTAPDYNESNMITTMQNGINYHQPMIIFADTPQYQPNTMVVSGLNFETSNTDKLFNLLSLYGNVARIQFLPTQQGTAVVQMFDQMSVEYCINYLDSVQIGVQGNMRVNWTMQSFQLDSNNMFILPDGSYSYKDFTDSKNQRFLMQRPTYWIQPPSKIVRFYNTPLSLTQSEVMEIFMLKNVLLLGVNLLPISDETHSSRGLLEFQTVAQAVYAVMKLNNKILKTHSKVHYMKLCFSSSQTLELKN